MAFTVLLVGALGAAAPFDFKYFNDTDFPGNDVGKTTAPSAEACAAACFANPLCVAASWNGPASQFHDNTCNLHCSSATKDKCLGEVGVVVRPQVTMCGQPAPPQPPGWTPPGWAARFAAGNLLISSSSDNGAQIGNGYAAFFVQQRKEYVAGLFNGKLVGSTGITSHRVQVPSPLTGLAASIASSPSAGSPGSSSTYTAAALDLEFGAYLSALPLSTTVGSETGCIQRLYAHRALAHVLVNEVRCNNTHGAAPFTVTVAKPDVPALSPDMAILPATAVHGAQCWQGTTLKAETNASVPATVGVCHSDVSKAVAMTVAAGSTQSLLLLRTLYTSIDTNPNARRGRAGPSDRASGDPVADAQAAYLAAVKTGPDALWASHIASMAELTSSRIEVGGNPELGRVINATMNALLATVRSDVDFSSSPGGLATESYNGHTFWDVCTWMWPSWLAFHPNIAKAALQYRVDRLPEAIQNAQLNGYDGAMFPWESAYSGTEVDPATGSKTEEHLQSDIAFAFRQYWEATGDLEWLKSHGYKVIEGIARFWASKAYLDKDHKHYSINRIMGPDEYHGNVVDSVYCNVGATMSLHMAYALAPMVGQQPNETFKTIADGLNIMFDKENQYHPEFSGYTRGTKIKQADTILIGYPLLYPMNKTIRKNDLDYYATVTDVNGPAMTWSMFAINYGDVGEADLAAAYFERGFKNNSLGNYHDWHETIGAAGADNFITGAGGFIQSVYAGYGGVRFSNGTLVLQRPSPLPNSTSLKLAGLHFHGSMLSVEATASSWSVRLDSAPGGAPVLDLLPDAPYPFQPLVVGKAVVLPAGTSAIILPASS